VFAASLAATVRGSFIERRLTTQAAVIGAIGTAGVAPITIIALASKPLGATDERTDLNRGPEATPLSGHARRSRSATATHRWKVRPTGRHSESSQPSPTESLQAIGRRHSGDDDIEFANLTRRFVKGGRAVESQREGG
jgi:hypothetical protein